jgi:stage IV sporulation protein FB
VLAEPDRTQYDLNFPLFGFRVRVHPFFWLGTVLLGLNALRDENHGPILLLIWIAVVFVSILVHELGHALAYRMYGSHARIVLWGFGGLAIGSPNPAGRARRIFVTLAGPLAGFLLAALVYGSDRLTGWSTAGGVPVLNLYFQLMFVNIAWGVLNLFPVFPLDGGQITRELCEGKWRGRGLRVSLQISFAVAVAAAVYSLACALDEKFGSHLAKVIPWWAFGNVFTAILFAILAVQSYLLLKQLGGSGGYYYEGPDDRVPWER